MPRTRRTACERCLTILATYRDVEATGADRHEEALVMEARRLGASWSDIATAMQLRRQSVWERFADQDPTTERAALYLAVADRPRDDRLRSKRLARVLLDLSRRRESQRQLIAKAVEACREAGASWDEIGAALGISRQTANHRFRYLDHSTG